MMGHHGAYKGPICMPSSKCILLSPSAPFSLHGRLPQSPALRPTAFHPSSHPTTFSQSIFALVHTRSARHTDATMSGDSCVADYKTAEWSYYRYEPSVGVNTLFVILFTLTTVLHVVQLWKTRTWYLVSLAIGGLCRCRTCMTRCNAAWANPNPFHRRDHRLHR